MSISSDDFEVAPVFRGCIPLSKILLFRHHLKVFQFLTKKLIFVKEISIDKEQVVVIEQNIENSGLHNSKRQVKGGYKKVNKLYRRYTLLDVKHYWPSVFTLQNTQ